MKSASYHSEVAFRNWGKKTSQAHKAGLNKKPRYNICNTMGQHQTESAEHIKLNFVQHNLLGRDRKHTTSHHFVPSESKRLYEEWKVANVDKVAPHAGRYALVRWTLGQARDEDGEGGIVASYTKEELRTTQVETSHETWLDYIHPGYGEVEDYYSSERDDAWNYRRFADIDDVKQWVNFKDRRSHFLSPSDTPISAKGGGGAEGLLTAPMYTSPYRTKMATFQSAYGYGSEQFSPIHATRTYRQSQADFDTKYHNKAHNMYQHGMTRHFKPAEFMFVQPYKRRGQLHEWVKKLPRRHQVQRTEPTGREVWIQDLGKGRGDQLAHYCVERLTKRPGSGALINLGTQRHLGGKGFQPDGRGFSAARRYKERKSYCLPAPRYPITR